MILVLVGCFSIVSGDFDAWKKHQLTEETGFEIQDFGIDVAEIPAGIFRMGCTEGSAELPEDTECFENEYPVHDVEITRPFALMTTEVTQELYEEVIGENLSDFSFGGNFPVEMVSWFDAIRFANELSRLEGREKCYSIVEGDSGTIVDWIGLGCTGWRLPIEAEWEFAARGNEYFIYSGSNTIDEVAWYSHNSENITNRVAQKEPNAFGLYDMTGNVYEWVWNGYNEYSDETEVDPINSSSQEYRMLRGGSWYGDSIYARVSLRSYYEPTDRFFYLGFRLARTL